MRTLRNIALITMLAALAAPAAVAEAQQNWDSRPVGVGYDEGYRNGERIGQDHGRRGQAFNFSIAFEYRQGDLGYRPGYGSRDRYRTEFRRGFEIGYRAGYDRYGRGRRGGPPPWSNGRGGSSSGGYSGGYGGSGNRYDVALQTGFDDGYRAGLDDGRDGRRFDPIGEGRYRSGDHGYERWYGPRESYKVRYRDAFRQGYQQGFDDGRRYNRGRR